MAHEKAYAVCENMCMEETYTKEQIDDLIDGAEVTDGSITTNKLANDAVTSDKIADGAIRNAHLPNNIITNNKIFDKTITGDKIADGALFVIGEYEGNGLADRKIHLGFVPKAIIITGGYSIGSAVGISDGSLYYGKVPVYEWDEVAEKDVVTMTEMHNYISQIDNNEVKGFEIDSSINDMFNSEYGNYQYIAFR